MTEDSLHAAILELATPLAASMGLEIWGVEFARGKRSLLRIYVQSLGQEPQRETQAVPAEEDSAMSAGEGVDIDQCARFSRSLGLALDVEDLVPGAYVLEVSSPGMARPFFSVEQLTAYVGEKVELVLREPRVTSFPGRKSFRGPLRAVEGQDLFLEVEDGAEGDGGVVRIAWPDLKRARLAPDYSIPSSPKEKKGRKKKSKSKKN